MSDSDSIKVIKTTTIKELKKKSIKFNVGEENILIIKTDKIKTSK